MRRRSMLALIVGLALVVSACGAARRGGSALDIERVTGFAVVVDRTPDGLRIGFSADREATSGDAYDLTSAVWRLDDGAWNQPLATCVTVGDEVELGIAKVQDAVRPGLLVDRVIWVTCISSA